MSINPNGGVFDIPASAAGKTSSLNNNAFVTKLSSLFASPAKAAGIKEKAAEVENKEITNDVETKEELVEAPNEEPEEVTEEEMTESEEENDAWSFHALAVEEFNEENNVVDSDKANKMLSAALGATAPTSTSVAGAKFKVEMQINGTWQTITENAETDANGNVMLSVSMDKPSYQMRVTLISASRGYKLTTNNSSAIITFKAGETNIVDALMDPLHKKIEDTRTYSTNAALTGRVNDYDIGWLNPFFSLKNTSSATKSETGKSFDTIGLFSRDESQIRSRMAINNVSTDYKDSDHDNFVSLNSGFVGGYSVVPVRATVSSQSVYGKNFLGKGSGFESADILFPSGTKFLENTKPFKYNDTPALYGSVTFKVTGMVQEDGTAVFRLSNSINNVASSIVDMEVLVPYKDGEMTMTLYNMPVGKYVVTLNNKNWTWRYNSVTISSNNDKGEHDNKNNLIIYVTENKDTNIYARFSPKDYIWRSGSDLNGNAKDFNNDNYIYNYQTDWINQGGHYSDVIK